MEHKTQIKKETVNVNVNWSTVVTVLATGLIMFFGSSFIQSWQSKQTEADIRAHEERLNNQDVLNATISTNLGDIKEQLKEIKEQIKK